MNWLFSAKNKTFWLLALLCALLGGVAYWWFLIRDTGPSFDETLVQTLSHIPDIYSYTQEVETETTVSDRLLHIEGVYSIDGPNARFSSLATTTLTLPGVPADQASHSFTLENISIGDDVYTKIQTESDLLKNSIPQSPTWRHFVKGAIPPAFENIAIIGPTLDQLLLFRHEGAYLELVANHGVETLNGLELAHYTFKLSEETPSRPGGTLATLLNRIGAGTIDVWIDPVALRIHTTHIAGSNYISTTTLTEINAVPPIVAPLSLPE